MAFRYNRCLLSLFAFCLAGCEENAPPPPSLQRAGASPAPIIRAVPPRPRLFFTLERGNPNLKEVALTFDDGPHPEFTPMLLDRLRQLNVRATFFMVGEMAEASPQLARRIAAEGHEAANHSYSHPNLKKLPPAEAEREIEKGAEAIRKACGADPLFFRPPGGNYNDEVLRALAKIGSPLALWTYNPKDFASPPAAEIERGILQNAQNGMIVLLHSGIMQTYDILPKIVSELRKQGYAFVTLSEMAQHAPEIGERIARAKQLNN